MNPSQAAGGHYKPEKREYVVNLLTGMRDNKRELGTEVPKPKKK